MKIGNEALNLTDFHINNKEKDVSALIRDLACVFNDGKYCANPMQDELKKVLKESKAERYHINEAELLRLLSQLQLLASGISGNYMHLVKWQLSMLLKLLNKEHTLYVYTFNRGGTCNFLVEIDTDDLDLELEYYYIYNETLQEIDTYFEFMLVNEGNLNTRVLPEKYIKVTKYSMCENYHDRKIRENYALLEESVFKIDDTDYHGWYITVSFYIIVHIIEKKLYDIDMEVVETHSERKAAMRRWSSTIFTPDVMGRYDRVHDLSRDARYRENKMTEDESIKVKKCLEFIKNELYKTS